MKPDVKNKLPDRPLVRADLDDNIDKFGGGKHLLRLSTDCNKPVEAFYCRGSGVLALRCTGCKRTSYLIAVAALDIDTDVSWLETPTPRTP